jgi:hypothetical protein
MMTLFHQWAGRIAGALLSLLGAIWILQGFNILGGSRMSGDMFWAEAGAVVLIVGLAIIGVSVRRSLSRS